MPLDPNHNVNWFHTLENMRSHAMLQFVEAGTWEQARFLLDNPDKGTTQAEAVKIISNLVDTFSVCEVVCFLEACIIEKNEDYMTKNGWFDKNITRAEKLLHKTATELQTLGF